MSIDIGKFKTEKIEKNLESRGYESIHLIDGSCPESGFRGVVLGKKEGKFYLFDYACVFNNAGNIIASSMTPKLDSLDSVLHDDEDEINGAIFIFAKGNKVIMYVSGKNIIKEYTFPGKHLEGTLALSYESDDFEYYFLSVNGDTIYLNKTNVSENGVCDYCCEQACILSDSEEITDYKIVYTINDYARAANCVCNHIPVILTYKDGRQRLLVIKNDLSDYTLTESHDRIKQLSSVLEKYNYDPFGRLMRTYNVGLEFGYQDSDEVGKITVDADAKISTLPNCLNDDEIRVVQR